MALSLASNTQAIGPGRSTSFKGAGGVEPYVYSVVAGGAGGTVDPSTGEYLAPLATGLDTIQVEDDVGAIATRTISILNPLGLVCDIIQKEMGLADGQVYFYNQKINIPIDSRIYIAVGFLMLKPFGNDNRHVSGVGLDSVQSINMQATLSVDILSRSTEALDRKEEVLLALNSDYAESQMELNSFYIARITSGFANLSQEDGAAIPYRFNLSVGLQYLVTKAKAVPYFDEFEKVEVTTEP